MRVKMNTLSQKINLQNPAINLPRSSIHDCYILKFEMAIKNTGSSSVTPTITQYLEAIEQIVVTSDSTRVHYSLSGLDLTRRNAMLTKNGCDSRVLDLTFSTVAASATGSATFVLFLDEGDIIAVMHDNLELKVTFKDTVTTGVTVTAATVTATIAERIPVSAAELISKYGENFEYAAEPKVYVMTQACAANTELTGFFDLPTGTLLTGAMLHFSTAPEQVGILQTVPDRVELEKIDWAELRAIDERRFGTKIPTGVVTFDYGAQWMDNGLGKDAWNYNKGDIQIAAKAASATTLRYVSFERLVNTAIFGKTGVTQIGGRFVQGRGGELWDYLMVFPRPLVPPHSV